MLASASADGVLIFWDVLRGERRVQKRHHLDVHMGDAEPPTRAIYCVAWSPDDKLLATCAGSAVKLWDPDTGECQISLPKAEDKSDDVQAVAWLKGGSLNVPALMSVFCQAPRAGAQWACQELVHL